MVSFASSSAATPHVARLRQWLSAAWIPGTLLLLLGTGFAQWKTVTPVWRPGSPVELSSELFAALGLTVAGLHALAYWRHARIRWHWLAAVAAMALVWVAESVAEETPVSFGVIIGVWAVAAVLLVVCVGQYASDPLSRRALRLGLLWQVVAHLAWTLRAGWLDAAPDAFPGLEWLCDTGELCALALYGLSLHACARSGIDAAATDERRLARWANVPAQDAASRPRICFLFNAQQHQVLHALPIAAALAERHPDVDLQVATTRARAPFIRGLLQRHAPRAALPVVELRVPWYIRLISLNGAVTGKKSVLRANALYVSGFDAVVVPERTSTYLRELCPPWTRLVGTEHGAGDREVTFAPEIARFDFVMLPGDKQARRLRELGYVREGAHVSGVYSKFDWAQPRSTAPRRFANDRPTVLYSPHFDPALSSWPLVGWRVLDYFAASTRYNLIFAPHLRLFDAPTAAKYRPFQRYRQVPHLHIDLGSPCSVDMTYTSQADLFLGDVSSQVVEFLVHPRPCVFLNPRHLPWQDDLHFRFWHLGPVIGSIDALDAALSEAMQTQATREPAQRAYIADTFAGVAVGHSAERGADALIDWLRRTPGHDLRR